MKRNDFNLREHTPIGYVIEDIKSVSPFIKEVEFLDIYNQNVSFRIAYQDPDKNITQKEVNVIRGQIIEMLKEKYGAALVGKI